LADEEVDDEIPLGWRGAEEEGLNDSEDPSDANLARDDFGAAEDEEAEDDEPEIGTLDEIVAFDWLSRSGVVASATALTTSEALVTAAEAVSFTVCSTLCTPLPLAPSSLGAGKESVILAAVDLRLSAVDSAVEVVLAASRAKRFLADLDNGALSDLKLAKTRVEWREGILSPGRAAIAVDAK
jgi:hypothetical protein